LAHRRIAVRGHGGRSNGGEGSRTVLAAIQPVQSPLSL
jgi:hypothetical protein